MATMDMGVGTTKAENDFDIVLHYYLYRISKNYLKPRWYLV